MVSSQDITSFVCACGVPGAVWQEQHMDLYSCWNRTFPSDLAGNQTWRTITVFDGNQYKLSMNGYDSVMFLEVDGRLERGSGFQVTFSEFVMLTAYRLPLTGWTFEAGYAPSSFAATEASTWDQHDQLFTQDSSSMLFGLFARHQLTLCTILLSTSKASQFHFSL